MSINAIQYYRAFQNKCLNMYFAYPITMSFEPQIFKILVSTPHNYEGIILWGVGTRILKILLGSVWVFSVWQPFMLASAWYSMLASHFCW